MDTKALKYMLLSKVMLNLPDEVTNTIYQLCLFVINKPFFNCVSFFKNLFQIYYVKYVPKLNVV